MDAAGERVHGDEGAGHLGHLAQAELALAVDRLDIDHVARGHGLLDRAPGPLDAVGRDHAELALAPDLAGRLALRLQADARLPAGDFENGRQPPRLHVAESRHLGQGRAPFPAGELDLLLRAAPAARLVVADEAVDQGLAGDRLQLRVEGGAHRQAALVELLLAVAIGDLAAHLFGEEARRDRVGGNVARVDAERLLLGLIGLFAWSRICCRP